ncbi:ABC transporter substrate-binding protein [Herbiconiux daphne]|uniref:ABC transporter substrate-binding protein n=1 Tax=Herbiconiux daphne TaxID=2970914 RepID=A0ABT2H7X2_9MICO|nr:ABC transporter substrate-binding protein [Herbiconiux daphne]MCS5736065.1 ABC transporter substrate-binding protein [Herbiconiux daphne]
MISKKRSALIALMAAGTLALAACSSSSAPSEPTTSGDPVSGGTLRVLELAPPIGFDPAQVFSSNSMPVTYTALYGQFMVADETTGEYVCGLCESFTSSDGGATYDVVMPEGLTFTDGTPLDAEAIKYNWDRLKDPALGSASAGYASQIDHIDVVDDLTAKLTLKSPNPGFVGNMPVYALQWIASPTALAKGTEEFNKNPVGAGPFVLDSWTPNGTLKLTKNPDYYDAPKPYLDALEIQGVPDNAQRLNALLSGQADLIMNSEASVFEEGKSAGFVETRYTFNGGVGFMFNTSAAPFDDPRARQAIAYALDLDALSDAATAGYPSAPKTLFSKDSPYYEDIPLQTYDPDKAQELFDELADEGKPLEFSYALFPGNGQSVFDALQAQLSSYDNVTVTADQRDSSEQGVIGTTGDYQVLSSSLAFSDPSARLWGALFSTAGATNYSRFNDPVTDAALTAAGAATDVDAKKEQYSIVQQQVAELDPYILFQGFYNGALSTEKVKGIEIDGWTTPPAAELWLQP